GNFGIVTYFDVMSHSVSNVSTWQVKFPWSQSAAAITAFLTLAPAAPDELASTCYLKTGSTGPSIECFGQYLGPQAQLPGLLKPLTDVSGIPASLASSSYLDAQLRWAGCSGLSIAQCHLASDTPGGTLPRGSFIAKSDYLNAQLPAAALATVAHWLEQSA